VIEPIETHREYDKVDTHPGPDALHFWPENGEVPSPGPVPDGTTGAATGGDATPSDASPRDASSPGEAEAGATPGETATWVGGAKRPVRVAVECPTDALGHMAMDDDGAPPVGPWRAERID
jgi:hypothetical protein